MEKYNVSLHNWEEPGVYQSETDYSKGDVVVVENETGNKEIGTVLQKNKESKASGKILRAATQRDIKTVNEREEQQADYLEICRKEAKRLNLEMKLVDSVISLDNKCVTFVFTAEGRVDFRELVKNLSQILKRAIRMRQIGSRDEARNLGGYGICGREFCCTRFPGSLQSISTDMARSQLINNRGSERISGLCGRLMCCLAFEAQQYEEMKKGLPEPGTRVNTEEGEGIVIEVNIFKRDYKVKLKNGNIITVQD